MNVRSISSVAGTLGQLLLIEALLMLVPLGVCLVYGERDWMYFALASASAALTGAVAEYATRNRRGTIHSREGFVITALVWIVFGLFGAIPLVYGSSGLSFTDAMFEIISGFTTTGASVIPDVGAQSRGILFWRAFAQWIGGLGIILFMLAVLPELNRAAGISMFNAEATGITHDKLHPKIRQTAVSIWCIYSAITLISIFLLWIGPVDFFDSVCQTFAAVSTGGFTTHNEGVDYWNSLYVLVVLTGVMFVSGLNFMLIYSGCRGGLKEFFRNDVLRWFCFIVAVAYLLLLLSLILQDEEGADVSSVIVSPLFHIVSAVTSTGFSLSEAEGWGAFSLMLTIMLMLSGACAGSTSGGIKIDRIIVLGRNFVNEVKKTVFPKRIYVVSINGSALQNSLVSRITAFVTLYMVIVVLSSAIVTFFGYGFTDSLFMVVSCIGCNGLGYGATGAGAGYAFLPDAVKWVLTADMLVGRLELFTFMVLLLPSFWRR